MNKLIATLLVSFSLLACGGGGTGSEPAQPHQQLVGEVFDMA